MSASLDSCVLLIQECSDRKQLRFSKNNTDLSQPNHFPVHKVWHWPTLRQVGTYIPVGSYIRFQDLSGRYLNSSRFFNSGHRSNLFFIHPILFWIDELIHLHSIYISSMNIEFHLWHFEIYLQWKCLNFNNNFTEVYSHTVFETLPVGAKSLPILTPDYCHPPQSNFTECKQDMVAVFLCTCQWSMS